MSEHDEEENGDDDNGDLELPDDWEDMSEEEQQAWIDEQLEEYSEDEVDDVVPDDDEEPPDRARGSSVVEGQQLQFESEIELVGGNEETILVDDTPITGAFQYRRMADGRESQYLREIEAGSGGDSTYGADDSFADDNGDDEGDGDTPDEEPPETVVIEAWLGHNAVEELRELRQLDDTFDVDIQGDTLTDMELVELEVEAEGLHPYAYYVVIEAKEWREIETDDPDDGDYGTGGPGDGDPVGELEDHPASGSEDDRNEIVVEEGETERIALDDGQILQHVDIDATAEGADVQIAAVGNNWEISNIAIEGGDDQTPAITTDTMEDGSGTISNVMIDGQQIDTGDGDDSPDDGDDSPDDGDDGDDDGPIP